MQLAAEVSLGLKALGSSGLPACGERELSLDASVPTQYVHATVHHL